MAHEKLTARLLCSERQEGSTVSVDLEAAAGLQDLHLRARCSVDIKNLDCRWPLPCKLLSQTASPVTELLLAQSGQETSRMLLKSSASRWPNGICLAPQRMSVGKKRAARIQ